MRYASIAAAVLLALSSAPVAQDATPQQTPRFRAGANLVRVDAYVTQDGEPVGDLTAADFEVLEDGAPQRIERVQLIKAARPGRAKAHASNLRRGRRIARDDGRPRCARSSCSSWTCGTSRGPDRTARRTQRPSCSIASWPGRCDWHHDARDIRAKSHARAAQTSIEGMLRDNWQWAQRGSAEHRGQARAGHSHVLSIRRRDAGHCRRGDCAATRVEDA